MIDFNVKIDNLQDQINKLGEEIALDINQLESLFRSVKTGNSPYDSLKKSINQSSIL